MPKGGAVLAGLASQGGQSGPTLQPASGVISPLAAQYAQWTLGRTPVNVALPRDPSEFLRGAFGPLMPITPVGIDEPKPGAERPEPRRWQYPVGWNMPMGMPGTEGLKLADFQTLRLYADLYSVARACIQLRKDEMLGVGWDIGPTDDAAKAMRGDPVAMADFGKRRAEAVKFFTRPDPNFADFTGWFGSLLEDMLVIDAVALYIHPSRLPGKGLFGTSLGGLDSLDGSLIRPLVDLRGGKPAPPNPAYQFYQYGIPRVDLMSMLSEEDIKDLGAPVRQYSGDQLIYLVRNPRTWTVYGQAPLERCVIPVITGLRKQQSAMDFYQEGSIPGVYISPGDLNMTPNQIRDWQDTLNAIAGDIAYKHKVVMTPPNSRIEPLKPPQLADQSDEIIMSQVCMAFSVMPMELGITPRVSTTQSPGAANQMAKASQDIHERKTLKPDLLWWKSVLFDRILQDVCGQRDMEWKWDGLEEDEDLDTLTTLLVTQIGAGLSSIDEARIEMGRLPWGLPITSDPGWATQNGFTPLGQMSPSGAPEPLVAPPPPPGAPPGGAPGAPGGGPPGGAPAPGAPPPSAGPQPPQAPQSPAHAAHTASAAAMAPKAALSELDALRRHLHKGMPISDWEPRHLEPRILSQIAEHIARGYDIELAIAVQKTQIPLEPDAIFKVGPHGYIHGWICVDPPCGPGADRVRIDPKDNAVVKTGSREMVGTVSRTPEGRWAYRHVSGHASTGHSSSEKEAAHRLAEFHNTQLLMASSANETARRHMRNAGQAMLAGDRARAASHLEAAHRADPANGPDIAKLQQALAKDAHGKTVAGSAIGHRTAAEVESEHASVAESAIRDLREKAEEIESTWGKRKNWIHAFVIAAGTALGAALTLAGVAIIPATIAGLLFALTGEGADQWLDRHVSGQVRAIQPMHAHE